MKSILLLADGLEKKNYFGQTSIRGKIDQKKIFLFFFFLKIGLKYLFLTYQIYPEFRNFFLCLWKIDVFRHYEKILKIDDSELVWKTVTYAPSWNLPFLSMTIRMSIVSRKFFWPRKRMDKSILFVLTLGLVVNCVNCVYTSNFTFDVSRDEDFSTVSKTVNDALYSFFHSGEAKHGKLHLDFTYDNATAISFNSPKQANPSCCSFSGLGRAWYAKKKNVKETEKYLFLLFCHQ